MIKKTCLFIIPFFFLSCYSKEKPPEAVIQPERMKSILWDVLRAQAWAVKISQHDSTTTVAIQTKILADKVFQLHHIDSAAFHKSYNWYLRHPSVLKPIFDSIYSQNEHKRKELQENMIPD